MKVGDKFVKNGEVVEVVNNNFFANEIIENRINHVNCIWFKDKEGEKHVLTKDDFLEQYKPYEPVEEWQWAFRDSKTYGCTQISAYKTQKEFIEWLGIQSESFICRRIDFTKRERVQ